MSRHLRPSTSQSAVCSSGTPSGGRFLKRTSRGSLRHKLVAALLVTAAIPFGASLLLSERLADESLALGLNPRVVASLDELSELYPELIRARRLLAETRADVLATLPGLDGEGLHDPERSAAAEVLMRDACLRDPHLRSVTIDARETTLRIACDGPAGLDESPIELVREIPAGELRLVFGLERALLESHEEAAELAELYSRLDADRGEVDRAYRRSFLLLLGGWVVVAGLSGLVIASRATRRMEALAEATRRVSSGDLSARVETSGEDELSELGRAFNDMVEELEIRGERIVYLEKISSWQEMAKRLAHEIKNPLTPIQLAMQQLEDRWHRTESKDPHFGRLLAESVEIVREEIDTLGRLVGEFSAFARLPDVSPEPTNLVEWSRDFVRTHPDLAEQAAISFETSSDAVMARMDRNMMRRVLANLVQNAIDAAEEAGLIPKVALSVHARNDFALLRVADQGPGMTPETLKRAFDPYFTSKEAGTGLGLTICKKIVLQQGGSIAVASPPVGGTIFEIRLPAASS